MTIPKWMLARLALISAMLVAGWSGTSSARDESAPTGKRRTDHEVARRALSRGEVRPLDSIIAEVRRSVPGDIVGVELDKHQGRWTYKIKVITPGGRMRRVQLDARASAALPGLSIDPLESPPRGTVRGQPSPPPYGVGREPAPARSKSSGQTARPPTERPASE